MEILILTFMSQRGTKRKSDITVPSDEETSTKSTSVAPSGAPSRQSSNPPSMRSSLQSKKAMPELQLHKNTIISDEEEEDEVQPRKKVTKRSRRQVTHVSEDEDKHGSETTKESTRALKSMMDIDDGVFLSAVFVEFLVHDFPQIK